MYCTPFLTMATASSGVARSADQALPAKAAAATARTVNWRVKIGFMTVSPLALNDDDFVSLLERRVARVGDAHQHGELLQPGALLRAFGDGRRAARELAD